GRAGDPDRQWRPDGRCGAPPAHAGVVMRLRLATRPSVLFAAMLVVALIVFLPMRLALGATGLADQGLSARRVGGTIWGGSLLEARFGDVALGDLRVSLSPSATSPNRASNRHSRARAPMVARSRARRRSAATR